MAATIGNNIIRLISPNRSTRIPESLTRLFSSLADPPLPQSSSTDQIPSDKRDGILEKNQQKETEEGKEEERGEHVNKETGEIGGPKGPEPTRYGDWERGGRCSDF